MCIRRFRLGCAVSLLFLGIVAATSAATITVTGNGDTIAVDGAVTLREAIASINTGANINSDVAASGAYGTSDRINFSIGSGLQTISPAGSPLPALAKPAVIDGTTQPGFGGTPIIVLDGTAAGASSRGLTLNANPSTVRGLVIVHFFAGIELHTTGSNTIAGNYIGINAAGSAASPNNTGILVSSGDNNRIGGTLPLDRNVISGNQTGILISHGRGTRIEGNYIGTNAAGTAAVANGVSIDVFGFLTNIFGNVISGNQTGPILEPGSLASWIAGNLIGTDAAGTGSLGNVSAGADVESSENVIGGLSPSAGNIIAFNGAEGIKVGQGSTNTILHNSIFSNAGLGIDLGGDGVTANDAGDGDTGVNGLQNFPVITSAAVSAGDVTIGGTLNSLANTEFILEFFSSASCNAATPNNFGEGQTVLGTINVVTDASGNATFNATLAIPAGQGVITATATWLSGGSSKTSKARPLGLSVVVDTSEFSQCFFAQGVPPNTPTATPTITATNTPVVARVVVPTLSPSMLGLLALALAGAASLLLRRP